jgi:branched-chain amino acid transport system permease protein
MSLKSSTQTSEQIVEQAPLGLMQKITQSLFGTWERTQMTFSFGLVLLMAIAPFFTSSPYYLGILILTAIYAYIGISWNIVSGLTGQLLIAHIIFIALGGYTTIVLVNTYGITPWVGLLVGGIVAALAGMVIAFITLRYGLKMDYFALFTIALLVALRTLFLKWDYVGGAVGMWVKLKNPSLLKMVFATKPPYLYTALGLLVIGIIVQFLIYRSKMGRYFMAIREDEDAAAALGVNTSLYKTLSVVIGASMAGIGGGLYIMYVTFIDPTGMFNLSMNVEMVMAGPIIGGLGSLLGPLLGALVNKPIAELIRGFLAEGTSGISLIVYGAFLITSIMFMPRGLAGLLHTLYLRLTRPANQK